MFLFIVPGLWAQDIFKKMCMDLFSVLLLWKTYEQRIRHNKQKHYFNYFGKTMAQIVFLLIVPGLRSFFCFKKNINKWAKRRVRKPCFHSWAATQGACGRPNVSWHSMLLSQISMFVTIRIYIYIYLIYIYI